MRKEEKQKRIIGPAVLLLIIFIFSGLYLVEIQLNDLTRDSEFTKILNIKRDQETKEVMLYFMGEDNALGKWAYLKYDVNESEITISVAENRNLHIPYKKWYVVMTDNLNDAKTAAERYYAEFFH